MNEHSDMEHKHSDGQSSSKPLGKEKTLRSTKSSQSLLKTNVAISYEFSTFHQFDEEMMASNKGKEPKSPRVRKREASSSNHPQKYERQASLQSTDPQLMESGMQGTRPQRLSGGIWEQDRSRADGTRGLTGRDVLQLAVLMESDKLQRVLEEERLVAAHEAQRIFEEERVLAEQEASVRSR